MKALMELNNMPLTTSEQERYVEMAIYEILSGGIDPVKADMHLKAIEEVLKKIRGDIRVKRYVIEEAEKYGKTFNRDGVKITVTQRTTKDYTGCGDGIYNEMIREYDNLKMRIEARKKMLDTGVNPETGEVYFPPKTETSTFLTYKF